MTPHTSCPAVPSYSLLGRDGLAGWSRGKGFFYVVFILLLILSDFHGRDEKNSRVYAKLTVYKSHEDITNILDPFFLVRVTTNYNVFIKTSDRRSLLNMNSLSDDSHQGNTL